MPQDFFTKSEFDTLFPDVQTSEVAIGSDKVRHDYFNSKRQEFRDLKLSQINKGTYLPIPYKEKLILKGRGKIPRLISIPSITDRFIMSGLNVYLQNYLMNKQKMPQQLVSELGIELNNYKNYIRLDITAFYDNLNRDILLRKLENLNIDNRFIKIIKAIISQHTLPDESIPSTGIPQGLPVSNVLAQLYLDDFHTQVSKIIKSKFKVIRYVDDVVILFNDRAYARIATNISRMLKQVYEIEINKAKTQKGRIKNEKMDFLGYRFMISEDGDVSITIREDTSQKIRTKITNIIVRNQKSGSEFDDYKYRLAFQLRTAISGMVVTKNGNSKKYGWIFFYSQITDKSVFFVLDKFLRGQLRRRFTAKQVEFLKREVFSFVRSYFEMKGKKSGSKYAVHPDRFSIDEQKEFLRNVAQLKVIPVEDKEVEQKFKRELYKVTKNLEEDTSIEVS